MVSSTRMQYRKAQTSWEVDEPKAMKSKCPNIEALRKAAGTKKAKNT